MFSKGTRLGLGLLFSAFRAYVKMGGGGGGRGGGNGQLPLINQRSYPQCRILFSLFNN